MLNNGREQRYAIKEDVFAAESGQLLGHTLNMNSAGMLMLSKQTYTEGDIIRIRVHMPLENQERVSMSMLAECRWASSLPDSSLHQSGFRFKHPNLAQVEYTKVLLHAMQ